MNHFNSEHDMHSNVERRTHRVIAPPPAIGSQSWRDLNERDDPFRVARAVIDAMCVGGVLLAVAGLAWVVMAVVMGWGA